MLNKLKSSLALLGFVTLIGFSSCTEDETTTGPDTTAPTIGKAFITTTGSYWVYQNQALDTNGNIDASSSSTFDSTYVKSNYSLDGKQASEFITYTIDAPGVPPTEEPSTAIYSKEGEKVYINTPNFIAGITQNLPVGDFSVIEKWLAIFQDASNWDILTFPIKLDSLNDFPLLPIPLDQLPFQIKLGGSLSIKGKKSGVEEITINGTKYQAAKYATITSISAEIQLKENVVFVGNAGDAVATYTIPTETNIWLVNGIGIVKTETKPFTSKFAFAPAFRALANAAGFADSETKNGGDISTIIRYNVK